MNNEFLQFVINKHGDQKRKSSINGFQIPYFFHEFQVANLVYKLGFGNYVTMHAAAGHDLFEDTNATSDEILSLTNEEVVDLIIELTFDSKVDQFSKEDYIKSFKYKSINALVIKICDRLCNVADFALQDGDYYKKYMRKAGPLFVAYEARKDEVIQKFGEKAYQNLEDLIHKFLDLVLSDSKPAFADMLI